MIDGCSIKSKMNDNAGTKLIFQKNKLLPNVGKLIDFHQEAIRRGAHHCDGGDSGWEKGPQLEQFVKGYPPLKTYVC